MKISTPLKECVRYESGAVHDEFLNIPLQFHNELASRDYSPLKFLDILYRTEICAILAYSA